MAVRLSAARRRLQLVDVAVEVFATRGFHATSMNDVAVAAGITKPVLYRHFRSKRALYLHLLEDVGRQLQDQIEVAAGAAAGPRQQVEAGFSAYFAFVAERRAAFTLLFGSGARRDAEFADAVRNVENAIAKTIAVRIEAPIDAEHRLLLAHGLVGLAEGTSRHWMAEGRDLDPVRLARQVAELAWAGLRGIRPV